MLRGWPEALPPRATASATALAAVAALAALLGLAGCGSQAPAAASAAARSDYRCRDCNVLLISIDTLRADHLGAYGYGRDTSPNIDAFARQAVLFDQNINTGGGTLPVHASMFTSLPPTVHGVWADGKKTLAPERVTLAEQLHAAGYHTRGYTGGGFVRAIYGLGQGFDSFYDQGGDFAVELPMLYRWLTGYRGGKFFLFLHTYDVHSGFNKLPYDHGPDYNRRFTSWYRGSFDGCRGGLCASSLLAAVDASVDRGEIAGEDAFPAADREYMKGLYDGGIAYADAKLAEVFELLKGLGLWDRTLIVLTADHGEEFAEHHRFLHEQNFEEIARVPLLIRFPYGAFGGRRISELVSTLEVMPTILDVLGIAPNPEVEGRSLMPLIAQGDAGRSEVYMAGGREKLRTPQWSLFMDYQGPSHLFAVSRDPGETADVLAAHPDTAAALYARLRAAMRHDQALWRRLAMPLPSAPIEMSAEDRAHLRALGYLR